MPRRRRCAPPRGRVRRCLGLGQLDGEGVEAALGEAGRVPRRRAGPRRCGGRRPRVVHRVGLRGPRCAVSASARAAAMRSSASRRGLRPDPLDLDARGLGLRRRLRAGEARGSPRRRRGGRGGSASCGAEGLGVALARRRCRSRALGGGSASWARRVRRVGVGASALGVGELGAEGVGVALSFGELGAERSASRCGFGSASASWARRVSVSRSASATAGPERLGLALGVGELGAEGSASRWASSWRRVRRSSRAAACVGLEGLEGRWCARSGGSRLRGSLLRGRRRAPCGGRRGRCRPRGSPLRARWLCSAWRASSSAACCARSVVEAGERVGAVGAEGLQLGGVLGAERVERRGLRRRGASLGACSARACRALARGGVLGAEGLQRRRRARRGPTPARRRARRGAASSSDVPRRAERRGLGFELSDDGLRGRLGVFEALAQRGGLGVARGVGLGELRAERVDLGRGGRRGFGEAGLERLELVARLLPRWRCSSRVRRVISRRRRRLGGGQRGLGLGDARGRGLLDLDQLLAQLRHPRLARRLDGRRPLAQRLGLGGRRALGGHQPGLQLRRVRRRRRLRVRQPLPQRRRVRRRLAGALLGVGEPVAQVVGVGPQRLLGARRRGLAPT